MRVGVVVRGRPVFQHLVASLMFYAPRGTGNPPPAAGPGSHPTPRSLAVDRRSVWLRPIRAWWLKNLGRGGC